MASPAPLSSFRGSKPASGRRALSELNSNVPSRNDLQEPPCKVVSLEVPESPAQAESSGDALVTAPEDNAVLSQSPSSVESVALEEKPREEKPLLKPPEVVDEVCDAQGCGCADGAVEIDPEAWIDALDEELRDKERGWLAQLSQLQFHVLRMKGTEEIHTGEYCEHFEEGTYVCSGCALPLYDSTHKFRTGHGWPAFGDNLAGALVRHGKRKVEITCVGCDGHIGHVFKSSRYPKPHHERHCSNSISLRFVPRPV